MIQRKAIFIPVIALAMTVTATVATLAMTDERNAAKELTPTAQSTPEPTPTPSQLAPGQVDLSQIKEQVVRDLFDDEGFRIDPNERAGRISESHPGGYGGYYFSEDDKTVYVYMLDPTQQEAAEAAVRAAHGKRLEVENIVPVQGQFSMRQLVDWYRPLKSMLNEMDVYPSVSSIREIDNRINLGFRDLEEKRETIEAAITALDIPLEAIHLEESYVDVWSRTIEQTDSK